MEFETWFQEAGKLGAQRDWVLRDKVSGRQLGRATSTWVMINMQTRRLSKMPEFIRQKCNWFQRNPPQDAIPPAYTRAKIPEIELPPEVRGDAWGSRGSRDGAGGQQRFGGEHVLCTQGAERPPLSGSGMAASERRRSWGRLSALSS